MLMVKTSGFTLPKYNNLTTNLTSIQYIHSYTQHFSFQHALHCTNIMGCAATLTDHIITRKKNKNNTDTTVTVGYWRFKFSQSCQKSK